MADAEALWLTLGVGHGGWAWGLGIAQCALVAIAGNTGEVSCTPSRRERPILTGPSVHRIAAYIGATEVQAHRQFVRSSSCDRA
jgi:hypothetical protein